MKNTIVRLLWVELENFKNVGYGKIEMPDFFSRKAPVGAEILGLYGQNGSGKTAIIDAVSFLWELLLGRPLRECAADYITKDESEATVRFAFSVELDDRTFYSEYLFSIAHANGSFEISRERLIYAPYAAGKIGKRTAIIEHSTKSSALFSPKAKLASLLAANKNNRVALEVAKIIAGKEKTSFIFGEGGKEIFVSSFEEVPSRIISALSDFAKNSLFVIKNTKNEDFVLPVSVKIEPANSNATAKLLVEPAVVDESSLHGFLQSVARLNRVLCVLIPGLSLDVENYGAQMMSDGTKGAKIEMVSVREGKRIPIKYESEGIRKIISVLNIMIAMYNDRSVCMVVDELDAGIYEYLLGELLSILEESGSGQLIFTSHNLRPLEMIERDALVFTTTNPKNRYIRLGGVKKGNLRDVYLRSINLGGQKESVYDLSNSFEISHAMRLAGMKDEE